MQEFSASAITQNDSFHGATPKTISFVAAKPKPRDFATNPRCLSTLGAHTYDKLEDLSSLAIQVEETLDKLKGQWRQYDEQRLIYLIRKQTIIELNVIEERKKVRADQKEIDRKRREKIEEERERIEAQ